MRQLCPIYRENSAGLAVRAGTRNSLRRYSLQAHALAPAPNVQSMNFDGELRRIGVKTRMSSAAATNSNRVDSRRSKTQTIAFHEPFRGTTRLREYHERTNPCMSSVHAANNWWNYLPGHGRHEHPTRTSPPPYPWQRQTQRRVRRRRRLGPRCTIVYSLFDT